MFTEHDGVLMKYISIHTWRRGKTSGVTIFKQNITSSFLIVYTYSYCLGILLTSDTPVVAADCLQMEKKNENRLRDYCNILVMRPCGIQSTDIIITFKHDQKAQFEIYEKKFDLNPPSIVGGVLFYPMSEIKYILLSFLKRLTTYSLHFYRRMNLNYFFKYFRRHKIWIRFHYT